MNRNIRLIILIAWASLFQFSPLLFLLLILFEAIISLFHDFADTVTANSERYVEESIDFES